MLDSRPDLLPPLAEAPRGHPDFPVPPFLSPSFLSLCRPSPLQPPNTTPIPIPTSPATSSLPFSRLPCCFVDERVVASRTPPHHPHQRPHPHVHPLPPPPPSLSCPLPQCRYLRASPRHMQHSEGARARLSLTWLHVQSAARLWLGEQGRLARADLLSRTPSFSSSSSSSSSASATSSCFPAKAYSLGDTKEDSRPEGAAAALMPSSFSFPTFAQSGLQPSLSSSPLVENVYGSRRHRQHPLHHLYDLHHLPPSFKRETKTHSLNVLEGSRTNETESKSDRAKVPFVSPSLFARRHLMDSVKVPQGLDVRGVLKRPRSPSFTDPNSSKRMMYMPRRGFEWRRMDKHPFFWETEGSEKQAEEREEEEEEGEKEEKGSVYQKQQGAARAVSLDVVTSLAATMTTHALPPSPNRPFTPSNPSKTDNEGGRASGISESGIRPEGDQRRERNLSLHKLVTVQKRRDRLRRHRVAPRTKSQARAKRTSSSRMPVMLGEPQDKVQIKVDDDDQVQGQDEDKGEGEVEEVEGRGKAFQCGQCRYVTDRKNNLKRHVVTMHHRSSRVLECCGSLFHSKASLRDHVSLHHRGGYRCQLCSRNFCRKALLRRHLTVHSGQKDFACRFCGYATSHKSNLERHQRVHARKTSPLLPGSVQVFSARSSSSSARQRSGGLEDVGQGRIKGNLEDMGQNRVKDDLENLDPSRVKEGLDNLGPDCVKNGVEDLDQGRIQDGTEDLNRDHVKDSSADRGQSRAKDGPENLSQGPMKDGLEDLAQSRVKAEERPDCSAGAAEDEKIKTSAEGSPPHATSCEQSEDRDIGEDGQCFLPPHSSSAAVEVNRKSGFHEHRDTAAESSGLRLTFSAGNYSPLSVRHEPLERNSQRQEYDRTRAQVMSSLSAQFNHFSLQHDYYYHYGQDANKESDDQLDDSHHRLDLDHNQYREGDHHHLPHDLNRNQDQKDHHDEHYRLTQNCNQHQEDDPIEPHRQTTWSELACKTAACRQTCSPVSTPLRKTENVDKAFNRASGVSCNPRDNGEVSTREVAQWRKTFPSDSKAWLTGTHFCSSQSLTELARHYRAKYPAIAGLVRCTAAKHPTLGELARQTNSKHSDLDTELYNTLLSTSTDQRTTSKSLLSESNVNNDGLMIPASVPPEDPAVTDPDVSGATTGQQYFANSALTRRPVGDGSFNFTSLSGIWGSHCTSELSTRRARVWSGRRLCFSNRLKETHSHCGAKSRQNGATNSSAPCVSDEDSIAAKERQVLNDGQEKDTDDGVIYEEKSGDGLPSIHSLTTAQHSAPEESAGSVHGLRAALLDLQSTKLQNESSNNSCEPDACFALLRDDKNHNKIKPRMCRLPYRCSACCTFFARQGELQSHMCKDGGSGLLRFPLISSWTKGCLKSSSLGGTVSHHE